MPRPRLCHAPVPRVTAYSNNHPSPLAPPRDKPSSPFDASAAIDTFWKYQVLCEV